MDSVGLTAEARIAIDCMGGDGGPSVTVAGLNSIARTDTATRFLLFGDEHKLRSSLAPDLSARCELVHAPLNVSMARGLRALLREREPAALRCALEALRDGRVDGVISGADTGALMALSRHVVGMLPGIDRPAIAKEIVGKQQSFWLTDLGANLNCDATQLAQFAQMGAIAARELSARRKPRVALLNIGTEVGKGTDAMGAAAERLHDHAGMHFVGFVEGSRLFENEADVVVCDGLVGNTTLKAIEGTAAMAEHLLVQQLHATVGLQKALLALLRPTLRRVRGALDTEQFNGAAFLGLAGVVTKSHGGASAKAFGHALRRTIESVKIDLPGVIAQGLAAQRQQSTASMPLAID